jgi:hypothetical protein
VNAALAVEDHARAVQVFSGDVLHLIAWNVNGWDGSVGLPVSATPFVWPLNAAVARKILVNPRAIPAINLYVFFNEVGAGVWLDEATFLMRADGLDALAVHAHLPLGAVGIVAALQAVPVAAVLPFGTPADALAVNAVGAVVARRVAGRVARLALAHAVAAVIAFRAAVSVAAELPLLAAHERNLDVATDGVLKISTAAYARPLAAVLPAAHAAGRPAFAAALAAWHQGFLAR